MSVSRALRRRYIGGRLGVVAGAFILVAGCGTTGTTVSGTGTSAPTVAVASGLPATETATTEAPQARNNATAIRIASLPVGGDVSGDSALRCGRISWLGPTPIPHDVSVVVQGVSLRPAGVFRVGGHGCGGTGNTATCTRSWSWTWRSATTQCLVPLTQVVEGDPNQAITLVLSGTVNCVLLDSCTGFARLGGSQIQFTALPGVVSTGSNGSAPPSGSGTTPPAAPSPTVLPS